MPDESCRKCGGKLEEYARCRYCSQAILQVCLNCGALTEKKFHSACFYKIDRIQTKTDFREVIAS